MKRMTVAAGAAVVIAAVPVSLGLVGNASFSEDVPVRVPDTAVVLDSPPGPVNPPSVPGTPSQDRRHESGTPRGDGHASPTPSPRRTHHGAGRDDDAVTDRHHGEDDETAVSPDRDDGRGGHGSGATDAADGPAGSGAGSDESSGSGGRRTDDGAESHDGGGRHGEDDTKGRDSSR